MERILQIFQGGQTRGIKSSKETLDFLAIRLGASLISIQEGTAAGTLDLGGAALKNIGVGSVDRKSTRLNSSHTVISYAVFCLKKKTVLLTTGGIVSFDG